MASYGYGPPPPAPPPSQGPSQGGYPNYPSPYPSSHHQGGHSNHHGQRGGRGGHQAPHYPYNGQPPAQQYGQPQAGSYPPQGSPSNYPPQQWQPDQSHGHHPQQPHQSSPPNPQNYHPNYAPHVFQPQQPYGQQPPYQQPYGQPQYQRADAVPPPQQQWGAPQQQHGPQFGGGRGGGRGGHHGDRGGAKMMGPPIRIGFEQNGHQPEPPAPVSGGYYPQNAPAPYAAGPYQGYPPHGAPAPMPGPPQYDAFAHQNGRQHGRGGFHNNSSRGGRPHQFGGGGDRYRHNNNFKKPGGHAPGPHTQSHQKPDAASAGKKKKRKTNTLGLTPGDESEEDDFDEEAKLLELIGPDAINPTDIAAWIAERRQNFPTKARIKAKQAQAANGSEKTKPDGKDPAAAAAAAAALERQQQKAEKLRRQLEKVESSIKRKREQQDEGDEMRDVNDASPSISSNSDDEAPEALPTRLDSNPSLPPPPKKADPSKHCKYFSTGGTCGKKGKCRFVHDQSVREAALKERERNGGRMTLQQRLTLNDKDQEDLTIVKTLQYLKEKGTIGDSQAAGGDDAASQPTNKSHLPPPPVKTEGHPSLPPHPPPSVVSNSQTARYQGWNLSGFGNTGIKSGDL